MRDTILKNRSSKSSSPEMALATVRQRRLHHDTGLPPEAGEEHFALYPAGR
jgi:hypothetical protein